MNNGTPTLRCPLGHGEYPADAAVFCMTCGARLVPTARAAPPRPHTGPAPHPAPTAQPAVACATCGGVGWGLAEDVLVCPTCRWLRPLAPSYTLHPSSFMWAQDAAAMARLRAIGPLNSAAKAVSDKVGRRWVEATYNAMRLGENQLPGTYRQAVEAARLLGMPSMPEVYVSGDRMWDAITYGSDTSSFVIVGTALIGAFRGPEMLFILAREMGHCRAGHALWKTVGTFLLGQQGPRRSALAGGMLAALNPQKIVEGALDIPLLAWARQSEITADRAGLLAVGDEEAARRVLLSWSLKSVGLYRQINIDAWLAQQQEDSEDQMSRIAELVTSPTPYITSRLALLTRFARSSELQRARAYVAQFVRPPAAPTPPAARVPPKPCIVVRCPHCRAVVRVAASDLEGKDAVTLRCPNPACRQAVPLRRRPSAQPASAPDPPAPQPDPSKAPASADRIRLKCPSCSAVMALQRDKIGPSAAVSVRCPNPPCGKVLSLRLRPEPGNRPQPPDAATMNEEE